MEPPLVLSRVRMKAETFEVEAPDKAMGRFQSLLENLVRVPKSEVKAKRKRASWTPAGAESLTGLELKAGRMPPMSVGQATMCSPIQVKRLASHSALGPAN